MTDRYAELRAALDAATPGPWEWSTEICERGPVGKGNIIRVSLSAPRNSHAHARTAVLAPNWNTSEGDVWQAWISCNEANAAYIAACHPEAIRALLAERDALRVALEDELNWHEAQDKAISKQPNANTGHTWWRRMQHQEHAVVIRAALGQGQGGSDDT